MIFVGKEDPRAVSLTFAAAHGFSPSDSQQGGFCSSETIRAKC